VHIFVFRLQRRSQPGDPVVDPDYLGSIIHFPSSCINYIWPPLQTEKYQKLEVQAKDFIHLLKILGISKYSKSDDSAEISESV